MQRGRTRPAAIPAGIESPRAKLVYLYLATCEGATVDRLREDLGMSKLTLFGVLDSLTDGGYVSRADGRYLVEGS